METLINEGRILALVIGISRYPNLKHLGAPAKDADAIRCALIDPSGCAIPKTDVVLIPEEDATTERIIVELETIAAKATEIDRVFIFFAGHGERLEGDFGLISVNTIPGDPQFGPVTGSMVNEALAQTKAYGVFLVIDCCYGANFAEHAPNFFRFPTGRGYRVLLSSTRANEKSWEVAAGGSTLFSKHLQRSLDGSAAIGLVPGAIFLSDLARFIADNVEHDLKSIDISHHQEQTFCGIYGRDPLLFRQARLTQSHIMQLLARYSKRDLVRFARIAVSILVLTVAIFLMAHYAILERSRFILTRNDRLEIDIGRAGINAYGFPVREWQTDFRRDNVVATSRLHNEGGALNAPIETAAFPTLVNELTSPSRIWLAYWQGHHKEAREGLKKLWAVDRTLFGVVSLLPKITEPEDLPWLREIAASADDAEVQAAAWVAVARLAPGDPGSGLRQSKREPYTLPMELLSVLRPPCDETISKYIGSLLVDVPNDDYRSAAFQAALRLQCPIPVQDLAMGLVQSFAFFGVQDVAGYIDSRGSSSNQLLAMLPAFAVADPEKSDLPAKAMAVIARSARASCHPAIKSQLSAKDPDVQAMAAAALLAHCDGEALAAVTAQSPRSSKLTSILAAYDLVSAEEIRKQLAVPQLDTFDAQYLLLALGAVGTKDDIKIIQEFVKARPDSEEGVRIGAVMALHELKAPVSYAVPFLYSQFESGKLAVDWIVDVDPKEALRIMREAFRRGQGSRFMNVATRLPFNADDIAFLEERLGGPDRGVAAAILVQVANIDTVVKLLNSPDFEVRSNAVEFATTNRNVTDAVLAQLQTSSPTKIAEELRESLSDRKMIDELLSRTPQELRPWRASALAANWRPRFSLGNLALLEGEKRDEALNRYWAVRGLLP